MTPDSISAIGNTPLARIPLGVGDAEFHAKLEWYSPTGSLKDRIAGHMIDRAEQSGELTREHTLLEATSGNTGIALAAVAAMRGYRAEIVMCEAMSDERKRTLRALGAHLVLTPAEEGCDGAVLRAQAMAEDPKYYSLGQFDRETNPEAHYLTTGVEVLEQLPDLDCFVAGIGTGGTITGVGRRLKEDAPRVTVAGAIPPVMTAIQGLMAPEQFTAPILDLSVIDTQTGVTDSEAFAATRHLAQELGIFVGTSSGAVYAAARKLAEQGHRRIVGVFGDSGAKYLSTDAFA